jgi:diadenosine tetraphosphate (Ap4A) HIT family hydrolase
MASASDGPRRSASDCANGFCDRSWMRSADIFIENQWCAFVASDDDAIRARAGLHPGVLPGSGIIVPLAHRTSPFDLTDEEWLATRELLVEARRLLHDRLAPDGYTLGWNDQARLHAHLHVLPRFDDEPMWATGVRTGINVPENVRPDPYRPGTGRALLGA